MPLLLAALVGNTWASSAHTTDPQSNANATNGTAGDSGLTSLPIVTWKWHHVEQPYLMALWVLVCWLCKLGERRLCVCCSGTVFPPSAGMGSLFTVA